MKQRPDLNSKLDCYTFMSYYYLKEELIAFCKVNHLPSSGGKVEITKRIAHYLDTGEIPLSPSIPRTQAKIDIITNETQIESNFVCSETHRAFFIKAIGPSFTFRVLFQKWLKSNAGKTYQEAIEAYANIVNDKNKTIIAPQFEYNTYIRDFFEDNFGAELTDAIRCWNYKKRLPGHNHYEKRDVMEALRDKGGSKNED